MAGKHYKVLVAPLNWGLGHATRCIPVIEELLRSGIQVLIAAEGSGRSLLKEKFSETEFIDIPGIKIRYPVNLPMTIAMGIQIPAILNAIKQEKRKLASLIKSHEITHIISDNRYGIYSDEIPSVIICHQLHIKSSKPLRFLEPVLFKKHKQLIENFDELWIPDLPPPDNIAGELSDPIGITIPYRSIGLLSRFRNKKFHPYKNYDGIAIISGPEPQRTALEKKLIDYFKSKEGKFLMIRGLPDDENLPAQLHDNIALLNHAGDETLLNVLHPDTTLYCRPGYSTLMDLAITGHQKTVFIPTPGQTEQEYLAERMNQKYNYTVAEQGSEFDNLDVNPGTKLPLKDNSELLSSAIKNLLEKSK